MLSTPLFLAAALLPGSAQPELFRDTTFDAALAAASAEKKIVLVDFFTTWCGPCKKLDATTWKDAQVSSWAGEKCVAVKVDAEKEVELAKRYVIGAYPTVLLLKADGTEIDRLVGYKDAATFLAEANDALAGKDSVSRAKDKLVGHEKDPMVRQQYGNALAQKGRYEEALAELLWCYDHGRDTPAYGGVRLSFLLGDIAEMTKQYPPASKALEERRDAAEARLVAGSSSYDDWADALSINRTLWTPERTLALFDKLKTQKPLSPMLKPMIARELLPLLCGAKRYDDVIELVGDADRYVGVLIEQFDLMLQARPGMDDAARKQSEEMRARMQPMTVVQGCLIHEALLAKNQKDSAARVAERLIAFAPTGATYAALIQSATRAGAPEIAVALTERGIAAVPDGEKDTVRRAIKPGADAKK